MSRWTTQQVNDAAPDASSLTAARKLASPGPWRETGCNATLVWGQCQGSGKNPYQVSVDLIGPAYRCSCPSRKFPCKHALALLMLWSEGVLDESGQVASFAEEWATQRAERAAGQGRRQELAQGENDTGKKDPEAQARRRAERLARMDAGVVDFRLWLTDLVRAGLAAARAQPYSWWDASAARLVDAQLPGLADRVRRLGEDIHSRTDWAEHLLAEIGRWWTISAAWQGRNGLEPAQQAEARIAVGWAQPSEEVREADTSPGPWTVLGVHRTDDGRLQQQRTWLAHDGGEVVAVLDFAIPGQALSVPQLSGARLDVELARYPGTSPRRALFRQAPRDSTLVNDLPGKSAILDVVQDVARRLAGAPWRWVHPAALAQVRLHATDSGEWWITDETGSVPLTPDTDPYPLLSIGGGRPLDVFGELEDGRFRALAVWTDAAVVGL